MPNNGRAIGVNGWVQGDNLMDQKADLDARVIPKEEQESANAEHEP
jgi:hypothetical protein